MNRTKIEWADYTWNPTVGCRRGCEYCYARKINDRFGIIPKWSEPQFFPERMNEPAKVKKPSIIFVGSMSDLIADVSNQEEHAIVKGIIKVVEDIPRHRFMFLTKRPENYQMFTFPANAMLGTSIERRSPVTHQRMNDLLGLSTRAKKFVSFEPLMGSVNFDNFYFDIDLVIVGAMTGTVLIPKKNWFDQINHPNIFYKENIRAFFPELPPGSKTQIWSV